MTDPSDFKGSGGGWRNPPRPPRPPGSGGPEFPKLPFNKPPRKVMIIGGIILVFLLVVVGALVSGRGGIVEISDREVAVIVNYMTGSEEIVDRPGYKIFFPFTQQAFKFDKSPQTFVMSGDRDIDNNHVRKLTVRASDGSSFWFEKLSIQYSLRPSAANIILNDSGDGESFKQQWVRTFARSILRDEFGKYSAEEVADPSGYGEATDKAQGRLNVALEPHGIKVVRIITPRPKFEERYENAIAERKVADQTVSKLMTRADQLRQERERRLADIERDKATQYETLLGTLGAEKITAEKDAVRITKDADAEKIRVAAEGQATEQQLTEEARGKTALAHKEAEGLRARVEALATRGEILIKERLAENFSKIRFEIVPYRRDPAPIRIEHLEGSRRGGNQ